MKILSCADDRTFIDLSLQWLRKTVEDMDIRKIFVPAGNTPKTLYQHIEQESFPWLQNVTFVQIDELLDVPPKIRFRSFLEDYLPTYRNQIHWIDQGPLDGVGATILGLGINGHIAFHEPHMSPGFRFGEVTLSSESCRYLRLPEGTRGVSYGVGSFMASERVLLLVVGESKQKALDGMLRNDRRFPATWLREHPDLTIIYRSDQVKAEQQ
ncbi:6-phosphogluconolactonase [Pseudobacteriovorax antillogorgiicola]|uniref:6-phosphogluconolactonase/Glucosamine-6-phosphate isomerase/deaminase n=1 Tax=Pseudobacteriovorax antillogorgiicola TaxID=1513793 RepID=A0A1Y6CVK5_9BACT|nr:hypothetical protein [Pseudobacteriovorax antillogorgiicola]TCS44572.1 6-phosphogluconolactonase/glucosamine-6-phosphate isomerase/deaminase [Pseudobacteriovorax antillogorgiicola]SMF77926.1 6-phosphogluconolactonase/Glucosamine-6-phosphateisomerase/deaminase [Pseudobacteriovorax antillogorgiicola]